MRGELFAYSLAPHQRIERNMNVLSLVVAPKRLTRPAASRRGIFLRFRRGDKASAYGSRSLVYAARPSAGLFIWRAQQRLHVGALGRCE